MKRNRHYFGLPFQNSEYEFDGMLGIEGGEPPAPGGAGDPPPAPPEPFQISKEDWERTQSQLTEWQTKYGTLETQHNQMRDKFAPFLEGSDKSGAKGKEDPEPNVNDPKFGGDKSAYARALVRWEARQEFKTQQDLRDASQKEQGEATKAQEEQRVVYGKLTEADKRGVAAFPDYHQVIAPLIPTIQQIDGLHAALADCESPESVAYHFGKNPQEAYAFFQKFQSNPKAAGRELILLDHRFTEAAAANKQPAPRQYNKTQKPGGKSGAGESLGDRVHGFVWDEINGRS